MGNYDWKISIWLGRQRPTNARSSDEFVVQLQAPSVEDALVLAFRKYRESHKDLFVLGFYIEVTNLTVEKITRSDS